MKFDRLERTKVFRDPLYGYIEVDYKLISDLIDSKELQRLRRIRQLSGVSMVFQTAEHSRFTHALGAYHMANLVLRNVEGIECLSEYERIVFLSAALLHDVGHGPYSHAFENVLSTSHEEMTVKIILDKNTDVNHILSKYEGLDEDIASVISHSGKYPLIETFVSSQLDVDRMDFLSRDAYFTGATYGTIDMKTALYWSLNTGSIHALKLLGGDSGHINQQGREKLYDYYHNKFRLDYPTGIELPEVEGVIPDPNEGWGRDSVYANMTFGQNLNITMLQTATAYSSVVNGGYYHTPTIIRGELKDGEIVPLIWNHNYNDPYCVIGKVKLEHRDEGVYAYGYLNIESI